jgi:tRNA pseudouridine55 synthase
VSSHDIVAVARRTLGEKRIGHAGTLDPFATGLLLLLVGRATRLARLVHDEPKEYDATIRFGAETDTEDLNGAIVREGRLPSRAALTAAVHGFLGAIEQVPPAYSAKHVDGKRAYELARTGAAVELRAVRVMVHALTLDTFEGTEESVAQCRMRVSCGGGTYVRSLARDLARTVGSAAHLSALRRLSAGVFAVERAVSLEALQDGTVAILPALDALAGFPRQELTHDEVAQVARGIDVEARVAGDGAALMTAVEGSVDHVLVAYAERRSGEKGDRWQPRVVMREPVAAGQPADAPARPSEAAARSSEAPGRPDEAGGGDS